MAFFGGLSSWWTLPVSLCTLHCLPAVCTVFPILLFLWRTNNGLTWNLMSRLNLFTSTQMLYFNVIHSRNLQATGVRETGRLMAFPPPIQIQRPSSWGALQQSSDCSPHVLSAIPSGSHAPLAKEISVFSKGVSRANKQFLSVRLQAHQ